MGHHRKNVLSIFLTTECNLRCRYCYVNKDGCPFPTMIDFNFAKRGILDFFDKYDKRKIRFFGIGEPTVAFPLMKKIREWVHETTDGDCWFELQTNGYFSSSIADWIGKNIDMVWISCDGPPDIQNFYRPTKHGTQSAEIVEKNIRFLASQNLTLGCRATIGAKNIGRQPEMIDYFSGLGVKVIMSDPMFAAVKKEGEEANTLEEINLINYADNFLVARKVAESKDVFYGSIFTVNFDEQTEYFCRACIPYPHLTTDGYVTCCDMASSANDPHMNELIYGKYNPKDDLIIYNEDAIKKIQSRKASNMPHCKECKVLYNCAGACLGEAANEKGSMFGIKPNVCEAIRYLAEKMPLNEGLYPYLHP